ncbi:MAG: hypothetical protein K5905_26500 [Roseibium sp.]|nr:hypothetical protein [Roseibium sp.]
MNIFNDKFASGQVIKSAGISNATLQSWLKREVIVGQKDGSVIEGGGSPGRHRRFSFYNLIEIATAKALIDCGVSDLQVAFSTARKFAHTGIAATKEHPERNPGMPFNISNDALGQTLLCMSGEHSFVAFWQPGTDPLLEIRTALRRPIGFVILDMNELFDRVTASLGYHPQEVIEHAYSSSG